MDIIKKLFKKEKPIEDNVIQFAQKNDFKISSIKMHLKDGHICRIRYDMSEKTVELECPFFAEQFEDITQYHSLRCFTFASPIKPNVETFMTLLSSRLKNMNISKNSKKQIQEELLKFQQIKQGYDEKLA